MSTLSQLLRHGRPAAVLAAALIVGVSLVSFALVSFALVSVALVSIASAQAQPAPLRLSLDSRLEGPLAMFLLAQDRGYFREEGLDVVIDEGAVPLDPIGVVIGLTDTPLDHEGRRRVEASNALKGSS